MTISRGVYNQLFEQTSDASDGSKEKVIRLRPTEAKAGAVVMSAKSKIQIWTKEEHERFLAALEKFPAGPWKKVADFIGTKTSRQTMTHAQKYRQKIHRRQRGLRNQKKGPNNGSNSGSGNPTPVDTKVDPKGEPNAIVSPYGVADLQLKSGSKGAVAAAAGAANDQLLNILAQQATTIHDKPELMEVDETSLGTVEIDDVASLNAEETQGSPNNNLPSLAEILHLGGAEGQAPPAAETEKIQALTKDGSESVKSEMETEMIETTTMETRPENCKCNCKCRTHSAMKAKVDATATQPQLKES